LAALRELARIGDDCIDAPSGVPAESNPAPKTAMLLSRTRILSASPGAARQPARFGRIALLRAGVLAGVLWDDKPRV
jgi:hypothetical protein